MTSVGLVLGAGGLAGHAFEAGVLDALAERTGWDPNDATIIVGTSAGAGVAAYLRSGVSAADLYRRALGRPLSPAGAFRLAGVERPTPVPAPDPRARRAPRPASPRLMAGDLARPWRLRAGRFLAAAAPEGTVPTDLIGERVRQVHGPGWPRRATWICTLRLDDGARVVLGRDPHPDTDLATAVRASVAIPGYFAPVRIGGERHVDGGAHSPTNADVLADCGLDIVIVVSPMSATRPHGALDARMPARAWCKAVLAAEVRALRRAGSQVVVFEPSPADVKVMGLNSLDTERMARVAESARAGAARHLERDGAPVLVPRRDPAAPTGPR